MPSVISIIVELQTNLVNISSAFLLSVAFIQNYITCKERLHNFNKNLHLVDDAVGSFLCEENIQLSR